MTELDVVIKGLNTALSWSTKRMQLTMGSSTVHRWTSDGLSVKGRLRMKAVSEVLMHRRAGTLLVLVGEYDLNNTVTLAKSVSNKAES
ncbi:hypothetical protein M514_00244, partial [Trichuris suis]